MNVQLNTHFSEISFDNYPANRKTNVCPQRVSCVDLYRYFFHHSFVAVAHFLHNLLFSIFGRQYQFTLNTVLSPGNQEAVAKRRRHYRLFRKWYILSALCLRGFASHPEVWRTWRGLACVYPLFLSLFPGFLTLCTSL